MKSMMIVRTNLLKSQTPNGIAGSSIKLVRKKFKKKFPPIEGALRKTP